MSTPNNGGPAFPVPLAFRPTDGEPVNTGMLWDGNGMTLRDWLAGHVDVTPYNPVVTFHDVYGKIPTMEELAGFIALIRYAEADAMLAQRAKT